MITYYVDATNGSNGNVGYDIDAAFLTVARALSICSEGDDIYLLTPVVEVVSISKNNITLTGNTVDGGILIISADNVVLKTLKVINATNAINIDSNSDSTKIDSDVYFVNNTTNILDNGTNTLIITGASASITEQDKLDIAQNVWDHVI